jgi:hypothetical protein
MAIRLYLDEDVHLLLATVLRQRAYDAISAHECGNRGRPDAEQFAFARQEGRSVLTFNARDYVPLAIEAISRTRAFPGLIVSDQLPFRELLRRTCRLLDSRMPEQIANTITWLSDFR